MPVRVLLITGSLGPGGTELSVVRLAEALAARGRVEPQVALIGSAGEYGARLRAAQIAVDELGIRGALRTPGRLRRLSRLAEIVRRDRVGIIHTFLFDADFYGMLAARMGGPWGVITTRRAIKQDRRLQLWGYRLTNRFVDRIICNSEAVAEFTRRHERVDSIKLRVIPNGVDTRAFCASDRTSFRRRLGVGPETLLVGSLGTIKKVKGQQILLEAMTPLLQRYPHVKLCLAGEVTKGYGEELRRRVAQRGLEGQVLLPGVVDQVPDLLASFDLFVLPSLSEGMSNALLEAMAAGRAIVATKVGGNAENLEQGNAGLLVPAGDVEALRDAVARLITDAGARQRFGAYAADRAEQEYAYTQMLDRTERVYSELVDEMFGKVYREAPPTTTPAARDLDRSESQA
jgi:glycosyltransferase involved in cell wall biosynthesis